MIDRVALYLQDAHPIRDGIEYVKYAEEKGFEAVWQAESRLVRDAIVPMAAFAACTERIKVGSGVINNWTRNAALIAATFLTLDDLAPDRVICGIGAWWDPLASNVGIQRTKPLQAMREVVEVVRRLLNAETVTFEGEFVQVRGIKLDVVHGNTGPRNVPIYIGATGPKMLELSGEIADGVVLNYLVKPEYNLEAMDRIEAGAKRAGRSIDEIDRPQLVVCSMDPDRRRGLDGAKKMVTQYLAQQPHFAKALGADASLVNEIKSRLGWPATEEEIESAIARGAADRARFNGWPHAAVRVRLVLDQGQTEPVSIGVRFDNPLDMLRPGTSVAEPLGINLEQVESDSGAERIENVPVASPWVLSIADGKTVQLYTDRWYHLGADGDNDVVLDDPYVSGVHASVYATELDLQIEDGSPEGAPSTNGTWVNGFAVKSFLARVGDEITVSLGPDTVIEVICHDQTARGHS